MRKTRHTPGPWTAAIYRVTPTMIDRLKVGSVHHAVCTNYDENEPTELLVALCGDEPGLNSQSAADARLIAAAPELEWVVFSLVTLVNDSMRAGGSAAAAFKRIPVENLNKLFNDATKALAKSEGRSE